MKEYDPEAWKVVFYKIEPDDKIGVVGVTCNSLGERRTEVEVGYKYIALSADGEAFVRSFTAAVYDDFIGEWQALLSKHFELPAATPRNMPESDASEDAPSKSEA